MTDPKMRRRYIYMHDQDWERLRVVSGEQGITMSEVIRRLLPPGAETRDPGPFKATVSSLGGPQHVTTFTPAPKPTRKKR